MPRRGRSHFKFPTVMFITTTVKEWERLFDTPSTCDSLQTLMLDYAQYSNTAIMGFCLMPHHLHLIAGHVDGGPALSAFIGGLKSLSSRRLFPERHGIWMRRFDDVVLYTEDVFYTNLNYIHENPVQANLVSSLTEWKWSNARCWIMEEDCDGITKNWDWLNGSKLSPEGG